MFAPKKEEEWTRERRQTESKYPFLFILLARIL